MISIDQYIKVYENFIPIDVCNDIIKQSKFEDFKRAEIMAGEIADHRKCYFKKLDSKFETDIFNVVGKIIESYKNEFRWSFSGTKIQDTGYDHLLYLAAANGTYKEHVDHYDLNPRELSVSMILNDNYDGGDFSFFDGQVIKKKKQGSVVAFPSNFCFPHAVTPVSNGDRHSIITWII